MKNIKINRFDVKNEIIKHTNQETVIDTLDIYYININGIDVPHYILDSSTVTKETTNRKLSTSQNESQLRYITIPFDLQYISFINDFVYWGCSVSLEPGFLFSKSGTVVTRNGVSAISRKSVGYISMESEAGIKSGILLTSKLSIETGINYSFGLLPFSSQVPSSFIRNQLHATVGIVYSLSGD